MRPVHSSRRSVACGTVFVVAALVSAPLLMAQGTAAPMTAPARAATTQQPSGNDPGQYWFDMAQVQQRYQMTDEAEKAYAQGLEVAKTTPVKIQLLAGWGDMLSRKKDPAAASEKFAQALALTEETQAKCRIAQRLALALDQSGEVEEAADQYEFIMENANNPRRREAAQRSLFDLYRKAGKPDDLARRLENLAAKDPKDVIALDALVALYTRVKPDLEAARAAAAKIVALKGDDPAALMELADLEARAKDTENAVALYQKAAGLAPAQKAACYDRIAAAYMAADQKDKAIEWAAKGTEAEPQNAQCWARYGEVCSNAGQPEKAIPAFVKAVGLAQTDAERDRMKLSLAAGYRALKQDTEAIALYKELSENPKSPVQAQAKRLLVDLYAQKGMLDRVKVDTSTPATTATPGQ